MSKFNVGDRVRVCEHTFGSLSHFYNENDMVDTTVGMVTEVDGDMVTVTDDWNNEDEWHEDDLMLESDFLTQNKVYENEFNAVSTEIKSKLDQAASLLKEAYEIASKSKYDMNEFEAARESIIEELDAFGWSASRICY